jgi:hypothetical protein
MKTTNEIKIGGVIYTITLVPDLKTESDCSGKVIFGKAQILLAKEMCPAITNATLLHEIIEVINAENEYNLPHHVIQGLATQIYQVIADNPEVFTNGNCE